MRTIKYLGATLGKRSSIHPIVSPTAKASFDGRKHKIHLCFGHLQTHSHVMPLYIPTYITCGSLIPRWLGAYRGIMSEFWKPALQPIVQSKETSAQAKGITLSAFFTLNKDRCETMSMGVGRVTKSGELILADIRNVQALIGGIVRGRIQMSQLCFWQSRSEERGVIQICTMQDWNCQRKGKGEKGKKTTCINIQKKARPEPTTPTRECNIQ